MPLDSRPSRLFALLIVMSAPSLSLMGACGDDSSPGPGLGQLDATSGPISDAGVAEDGAGDGGVVDTDGVGDAGAVDADGSGDTLAPPPTWELAACDRACDRVTDCGVDRCEGWEWTTAGELFMRCWSACDGAFEGELLAAPSCDEVETLAASRLPGYVDDCANNPCLLACDRLGSCIVDICPGFVPPAGEQIAEGCALDCRPEDIAWVLDTGSCQVLVDAIAANDGAFDRQCSAIPGECAGAEPCAAYASKLTGCLADSCGAPLAPWVAGVEDAIEAYCAEADDCPPQADVDYILSPQIGCESEGLAGLGSEPPFDGLCSGTLPVSQAEAAAACEVLSACPGAGLSGVDLCAVYLALRPDAVEVVQCLSGSATCAERFECVSE